MTKGGEFTYSIFFWTERPNLRTIPIVNIDVSCCVCYSFGLLSKGFVPKTPCVFTARNEVGGSLSGEVSVQGSLYQWCLCEGDPPRHCRTVRILLECILVYNCKRTIRMIVDFEQKADSFISH